MDMLCPHRGWQWVLAAALAASASAAAASVQVDARTNLVLGDEPEISSRLFGLTAFQGGPSMVADRDYRARVMAIRPGCIRLPGNVAWCSPDSIDPGWYDTAEAMREFTEILLFGSRYPLGRFLPAIRSVDAEPMCSLGKPPDVLRLEGTHNPSDFDAWADMCAAYVGLWRRCDPEFRLVQIWNEPNAHWFNDPRAATHANGAAGLHIEMANRVARAIKARFPDMLVGGPVLCWCPSWPPNQAGKEPWYTWSSWTVPWLEQTADTIDFFDFHVYGVSPDVFAVQTEMLVNQSQITQDRRIPVWITESNVNLTDAEQADPAAIWNRRLLPYERFLLRGVLPQADKIHGNLYHDLHARHHTLLPRTADDPDPMYWLFWVLADLRGTRLDTSTDDPGLVTWATMEDDRVTTVVFNDSDRAKDVALTVDMPCNYWTGAYVRMIRANADGACEHLRRRDAFDRDGGTARGHILIPPRATIAVSFRMNVFGKPVRTRRVTEHFANRTLQLLTTGTPAETHIDLAGNRTGQWTLRIGLLGPEGAEPLAATLNGNPIDLQAAPLQDIAVEPAMLDQQNTVRVTLTAEVDNPRLALAFAALVQDTLAPDRGGQRP